GVLEPLGNVFLRSNGYALATALGALPAAISSNGPGSFDGPFVAPGQAVAGLAAFIARFPALAALPPRPPGVRYPLPNVGGHIARMGFLSFGHWTPAPGSQTRRAADSLLQHVELAAAAEEVGIDGAYLRVHHFARQLASPFPLLAAMAARTSRIELGTAVID